MIRGLGYNRIVTVNDGVRQEGQQWGDEHGIEIDPQTVNNIEILKGPASLMYGSDAMAGVVIFHDAPTLAKNTVAGDVSSEYQTNNGLFDYSLHMAGNNNGYVWGVRYSDKMAHAYKNKYDGYFFRDGNLVVIYGIDASENFLDKTWIKEDNRGIPNFKYRTIDEWNYPYPLKLEIFSNGNVKELSLSEGFAI